MLYGASILAGFCRVYTFLSVRIGSNRAFVFEVFMISFAALETSFRSLPQLLEKG